MTPRRRLRTAESGNGRLTPGSFCTNSSATGMSRTTTEVGQNTAPWWGSRSSWEAEYVLCTETRTDIAGKRRRREGDGDHRPGGRRLGAAGGRRVRASAGFLRRVHRRGRRVGDRWLPVLRGARV